MRSVFLLILFAAALAGAPQSRQPGGFRLRQYGAGEDLLLPAANPAVLGKNLPFSLVLNSGKVFMLVPGISLSALVPVKSGSFECGLSYSGHALHSQTEAALGYGRKLSEAITAGLRFSFYQDRIPGYGHAAGAGIGGGFLLQLTKDLVTGMNMRKNIVLSGTEKFRSGIFHAGLGYTVSGQLLLALEWQKEEDQPASCAIEAEYSLRKDMFALLGFSSGTDSWFFGAGMHFPRYVAELRFSHHPFLGWSPSLTLVFQKKKKNDEKVQ